MAGNYDVKARFNSDPGYRDIILRWPLFAFSFDTGMQVARLARMETRLTNIARTWVKTPDGRIIHDHDDYVDFFWFWLLGAYEVTRVMKQHQECFHSSLRPMIVDVNVKLAKLRIPMAKQELRGKSGSLVNPEVSAGRVRVGMIYEFDGDEFDSQLLVGEIGLFLGGITFDDILKSMHWTQP